MTGVVAGGGDGGVAGAGGRAGVVAGRGAEAWVGDGSGDQAGASDGAGAVDRAGATERSDLGRAEAAEEPFDGSEVSGHGPARRPTYGRGIALITVAGALLRVFLGARQGLGFDEDFTAVAVAHPLAETLRIVSRDSAPPLFYVLEHAAAAVGSGPWNLRLVPIAAGIALIPMLAALGRRLGGEAAGLWTAAFVAMLPATLFSSTNARMYGPAAMLIAVAILLLWRALERPGARRWVAFAAVAAAAVWTDYFAAMALAGVVVAAAWFRPPARVYAAACLSFAVALASILPWLVYAGDQLSHAGQGFWVAPLSPATLLGTAGQLFAGPETQGGAPLWTILISLQVVAAVAGWLTLAGLAVRRRGLSAEARRGAVFCLLACGGVAALVVVSVWRPLLDARYAGIMWLPLFALAGLGLASLPRRPAIALLAAVAVPCLALSVAATPPGVMDLMPEIEARVGPHDLVDADPDHYLLMLAEGSPSVVARLHVLAAAEPPWFLGTAAYPPGAVVGAVPSDVIAAGGSIFYVGDPGSTPAPLPAGYRERELRCAAEACLSVYSPGG